MVAGAAGRPGDPGGDEDQQGQARRRRRGAPAGLTLRPQVQPKRVRLFINDSGMVQYVPIVG